jgi:hypothetical protein
MKRILALVAGAVLAVPFVAMATPALASVIGDPIPNPRPATAPVTVPGVPGGPTAHPVAAPPPPINGCTVTVNGEKKHGTWSSGGGWCCPGAEGTPNESCYSCTEYTCQSGWRFAGPDLPPAQFEPAVP